MAGAFDDQEERARLYGCPAWCGEFHDHHELMLGRALHIGSVLHEPGGPYVALHQIDDEPVRVIADPGRDHHLTPEQARRYADALMIALERLDRRV